MDRMRSELRQIATETVGYVAEACSEAARSSGALEGHASRFDAGVNESEIGRILSEIIHETRAVTRTSRSLESHLRATVQEVETLREELERVKREASTDTLTGLLNRGAFEVSLREAFEDTHSDVARFSLVLLDIDHFKQVNDTYGHLIGDKVLRLIAVMLTRSVKGQDVAARYGGEEFAVLLPGTPLNGAWTVAETIRRTVEKSRFKRTDTGEPIGTVTVSLGIAQHRLNESPDDLVRRCDQALYRAKRQGRNRVAQAA